MGIHMRNGINYTWGGDGIAREIETIWDTGFTPSPGVWLTYDFGVDFEDYDELIFIIGRGTETNPITEFTMHPKKIGINSLNDVDSGLAFKFDVWGGNVGWIAHDSGTTYSLGAEYGGSPPKYIAIYGVKYINSSNNKYSYSTTEHKIGTWIDGSTLYEKTVTFTAPSNNYVTVTTNITNFDKCISYSGIVMLGNGIFEDINYNRPDSSYSTYYTAITATGDVFFRTYEATTGTVYITMRYTKTTS